MVGASQILTVGPVATAVFHFISKDSLGVQKVALRQHSCPGFEGAKEDTNPEHLPVAAGGSPLGPRRSFSGC